MTSNAVAGTGSSAQAPFRVTLDFASGSLTPSSGSLVRRLSDMASAYQDTEAVQDLLAGGDDPVIYSAFDADVPPEPGHLLFRTTIINPGTVGAEFYMTRGHHHVRDSAETYLGMSGEGIMLMESRDGGFVTQPLVPLSAVYVPPGWSHRTINTGPVPLVFLATYFGDAGHDYDTRFSGRVYRGADGPEIVRVTVAR
jgi:glucose-6-phosphate isomerase, archaeal